jgi:hypothetical protein
MISDGNLSVSAESLKSHVNNSLYQFSWWCITSERYSLSDVLLPDSTQKANGRYGRPDVGPWGTLSLRGFPSHFIRQELLECKMHLSPNDTLA